MSKRNAEFFEELRIWTDKKGRKIEAAWQHVSEDGKTIWFLNKDKKYVKVNVAGLSNDDAFFVNNQLKTWNENGCVWWRGVYLTKDGYRENRYFYKALNMIVEKSLDGLWDLEVFQARNYGALCRYGHHSEAYSRSESPHLIFWHTGEYGVMPPASILPDASFCPEVERCPCLRRFHARHDPSNAEGICFPQRNSEAY